MKIFAILRSHLWRTLTFVLALSNRLFFLKSYLPNNFRSRERCWADGVCTIVCFTHSTHQVISIPEPIRVASPKNKQINDNKKKERMQGDVGLRLLFFERIRGLPAPYRPQCKFARGKRSSNLTLAEKKRGKKERRS